MIQKGENKQRLIREYSKTYDGFVDFQGADVFIINNYRNKLCVILFEDAENPGNITMPGGRCETKHTDLAEVAHQELFEESLKTIQVPSSIFRNMTVQNQTGPLITYVDIRGSGSHLIASDGKRSKRRVYFCYMPHYINLDDYYYYNKQFLKGRSVLKGFKETINIILIPISNILSIVSNSNEIFYESKEIQDNKNQTFTVSRITIEAFSLFLREYNKLHKPWSAGGMWSLKKYIPHFSRFFPKSHKTSKTLTIINPANPITQTTQRSPRGQTSRRSPRTQTTPITQTNQRSPRGQTTQRSPITPRRPRTRAIPTDDVTIKDMTHYIPIIRFNKEIINKDNTITIEYK